MSAAPGVQFRTLLDCQLGAVTSGVQALSPGAVACGSGNGGRLGRVPVAAGAKAQENRPRHLRIGCYGRGPPQQEHLTPPVLQNLPNGADWQEYNWPPL